MLLGGGGRGGWKLGQGGRGGNLCKPFVSIFLPGLKDKSLKQESVCVEITEL